ncbi:MAG TPA: GNAT family N-acetyltransferase [Gaiellaceae bacterium]|nr:GNAT family N-acetyltransferase [Gaiellaceae bacterium]
MEIRATEDRDAEAVARLLQGADDARVVSPEQVRHFLHSQPERARTLEVVAEADGAVVATGHGGLNIWTSTEGAAWAFLTVDEAHRRRGIGEALGLHLLDHLRANGATKAQAFFRWTEEGERWATARGWSKLLGGPLIAIDPRVVPEPSLPPGYRFASMAEVAPEAVFEAVKEAALDEPTPEPHDAFSLDDFLRDWNEPDTDHESSTAVLAEDGSVAAFTFLNTAGERAQHGFTGTVREHRGRGLATAAKARALRTAAERGVTRVTTSNAEENAAMRAINRKLGFEPVGEHVIFGRDL